MKIYISGGITGVPDYKKRFSEAEDSLKSLGYEVFNPAKVCESMPILKYRQYMMHDLTMLLEADVVVLLPQWENSDGATAERYLALACRIPVYNFTEFVHLKTGMRTAKPGEEFI